MIEPTPARHETVILWHGDDYQPLADLLKAVETAATSAAVSDVRRLGDDFGTREATEAYDAFREEALTRATHVEMQALPRGGRNSDGSERVTWRGLWPSTRRARSPRRPRTGPSTRSRTPTT
jgi:hypothetical protein